MCLVLASLHLQIDLCLELLYLNVLLKFSSWTASSNWPSFPVFLRPWVSNLWPVGQILPTACFVKKVYWITATHCSSTVKQISRWLYGPRSPCYLPPGPLQEEFVDTRPGALNARNRISSVTCDLPLSPPSSLYPGSPCHLAALPLDHLWLGLCLSVALVSSSSRGFFFLSFFFFFFFNEMYCQIGFHTTPSVHPNRCPPQCPSPTFPSLPPTRHQLSVLFSVFKSLLRFELFFVFFF